MSRSMRVWDRASGRAIGPPLEAHDARTIGIAWLDRDRQPTESLAGTVIAWDMDPDHRADRACELAGRDLTRAEWAGDLPDPPYLRTCTGR